MAVLNKYHYQGSCPPGSVNIMRGSPFGNPYRLNTDGNREMVVAKYRVWLLDRIARYPAFAEQVRLLAGKDLCCCCAPLACHGDVLAEVAAQLQEDYQIEQMAEQLAEEKAFFEEATFLFGEMLDNPPKRS
jgi:hypothetical protein